MKNAGGRIQEYEWIKVIFVEAVVMIQGEKMLNEGEIKKLKDYCKKRFDNAGLDFPEELVDAESFIDREISYPEAWEEIKEKIDFMMIDFMIPKEVNKEDLKEDELKFKMEEKAYMEKSYLEIKEEEMIKNWEEIVKNCKSIAICGATGTGKTALAFYLLEIFKNKTKKKIYAYKFPNPEILYPLGIEKLYNIEELSRIENAVVFITEPQLTFPKYEKKNNDVLMKILSLARQRNIAIILDTSDSGYINRGLESYIEVFCVTDQEYSLIKQGSIMRRAIKDNSIIDPDTFRLKVGEYLFYSREHYKFNGKWKFKKPSYFNDKYSKAFSKCE